MTEEDVIDLIRSRLRLEIENECPLDTGIGVFEGNTIIRLLIDNIISEVCL